VTGEEDLLADLGLRIRWVGVGPDDGALYLLTDEDDAEILRITPAQG
jgi:glucose/arabinose dehydrogenase